MKNIISRPAAFRFTLLCFCVCIVQLASAQNYDDAKKLRIDPATAIGGTVSQYIDSVKFITFESTKESQFGAIFQLETSDNYFIILDPDTNSILVFTKQGKFHAKIKMKKNQNGEPLLQFNFDKKTNLIEVPGYPENLLYDTEGHLKTKTQSQVKSGPNGVFPTSLGNSYIAYLNTNPETKKDSVCYSLLIYKDGLLTSQFLPYERNYIPDEMDETSLKNFTPDFEDADTTVYYVHSYDYNVYKLTPHTLRPVYQFVFPIQNSLPKDFTTNPEYNNKRMPFFSRDSTVIPRIIFFYKNDDLLFFNTNKSFILNLKLQHFICFNKIVSDQLSYYLPVTESEINNSNQWELTNFDGTNFYTSYSSQILFDQAQATKNKNPKYPPQLAAYLSNEKNRKGNPVLVQIHFKPDL